MDRSQLGLNQSCPTKRDISNQNPSLLELPDLVANHIVGFLPVKTCLSLRLVCHSTKAWISSCTLSKLHLKKWENVCLQITGKGLYTFATIAAMKLPVTNFQIKNERSKEKIYDTKGASEFLAMCKDRPVRISVDRFSLFGSTANKFFSGLERLAELVIKCLKVYPAENSEQICSNPRFLSTTWLLEIREIKYSSVLRPSDCDRLVLDFIAGFPYLEDLTPPAKRVPMRQRVIQSLIRRRAFHLCPSWMQLIGEHIISNPYAGEMGLEVDMRSFNPPKEIWLYEDFNFSYVQFLQDAFEEDILFRHINARILEEVMYNWVDWGWNLRQIHNATQFLENVISLMEVTNAMWLGNYPLEILEEITINHELRQRQWRHYNPDQLEWKSLRHLEVFVSTDDTQDITYTAINEWEATFGQLFNNQNRRSVSHLTIGVKTKNASSVVGRKTVERHRKLFDPVVIQNNFINLKSLTVVGLQAPSSYFEKLFKGLYLHLQSVNLSGCSQVRDSAFLNLSRSPCFEILILDLNKMPLITEIFFKEVLPNIPLIKLEISAKQPLPITDSAMQAMKNGRFGTSIQTFPFTAWKSKYFSEKEKMQYKKYFRL